MNPARAVAALVLVVLTGLLTEHAGAAPASGSRVEVMRVIGHTVRGRPIRAWRIGDPTARRRVVLLGAIHGNETGPSRMLRRLRDGRAIHGADIWVVPWFNADGVARRTRQNAHGVDLNRNFPRHWAPLPPPYYSGPRPASEPETRALMRFLTEVKPRYVVSFHQPLYSVGWAGRRGAALVHRLVRDLHLPLARLNCNSSCHGTMTEWFNARFHGIAVTVEYGSRMTRRQLRLGPGELVRAVGAHY